MNHVQLPFSPVLQVQRLPTKCSKVFSSRKELIEGLSSRSLTKQGAKACGESG